MNVLILGGHGFIGSHVANQIKKYPNINVHIIDVHHQYNEYPDWEYDIVLKQRLDHIGDHNYYSGDVTDQTFMEEVFDNVKPDYVIDLATYPNAKMVNRNVVDATTNMITATAIALECSARHNVKRFVLASSSMVYGDFGKYNGAPDEQCECDPLTIYGSYKLQCEKMCKIYEQNCGLEYSILRPSALYGTRDMVVRVISKLTVGAIKNGTMTVQGPDNKLDFSWVEDVAEAFIEATMHPNAANQIFNCTRGNGRKIIDAAEIIKPRIPSKIITEPHDSFYPNRDTLDSSKLKALTNWNPSVDIEDGIPQYLDWFLNQKYLSYF